MTIKKTSGKSIRLTPDGFSFLIQSEGKNQHIYTSLDSEQTYQKQFEQAVYDHLINDLEEQHNIHIILHDTNFLLTPEGYVSQEIEPLLKEIAQQSQAKELIILNQKFANNSMINHFTIEEQVYNFLKRTFSVIKFHHHISLWSQYIPVKENGTTIALHLLPQSSFMDLIVKNSKGLQMANTYSAKDNEEILYNTLKIIPQFGIDQSIATIQLYGNQQKIEQLKPVLEKYIANIQVNTDENIEIILPNI